MRGFEQKIVKVLSIVMLLSVAGCGSTRDDAFSYKDGYDYESSDLGYNDLRTLSGNMR